MSKYSVQIIADAKQDLLEIYEYVTIQGSTLKADTLLNKLETLCLSLEHFPERGHLVRELERLVITIYREIHYKPYRIIYQIIDNEVYIHCVLDSRRDLKDLLLHRLLR